MATTQNTYTGNNSTTDYSFTFPYIKEADVKVSLDADIKTQDTDYTFANATTISFDEAPGTGVAIRIFRDTDLESAVTTFFAGSAIRAEDLNDNTNQVLFSAQERKNRDADKTGDTFTGNVTLNAANVVFEGANEDDHETTLSAVEPTADQTYRLPNLAAGTYNLISSGDTGTVTSTIIADGTIVNADINDSAEIAVSKLGNGTARQVLQTDADGTGVEFTSNVDLPGTLDVTGAARFDSSVTATTFTGNLTGNAGTANTLQTARNIGGVSFDGSQNINLPGVNAAGNQNTSGNAATATQLANSVNIAGQAFDGSTAINISPTNLVQNINGSDVSVSADANEINQLDGVDLIPTSPTWTSTTEIPSNAQISDRIAELGGFEAIANESSFPNTVPPVGVVISIGNANDLAVNGSGVGTGATVGGTSVTINGFPNTFNSTTLDDGIGLIVVKAGGDDAANQVYDFHRVLAKNEDVRQLSSDINDFKARYRTGEENPDDNNDAGDLFFNTGSNKMLVRNSNNDAWEEVQSIGEFFIIPSTDFPTWNGTLNDISITDNAPANAEQIILSINGVIQEPKSGTARPAEGFSLNGSTIQLSAAPAANSDAWGVIIGSTVNIGTPSANTVSTVKIQDHAVEYGKIQDISTDQRLLGRNNANDGIVSEVQVQSGMIGDNQVSFGKIQQITNANRVLGATSANSNVAEVRVNEAMLNINNTPTDGQFLRCTDINSTPRTLEWATPTAGIASVSADNNPDLGGDLDVVTFSIVSSSNRDINLTPDGTGTVEVKRASSALNTLANNNATVPVNLSLANNHSLTGDGTITGYTLQNPTNAEPGQTGSIFIVQPASNVGSGNTFTLTPDSNWHFAKGGAHPTFSTANGAVDRIDYIVRTPTSIHCVATFNYS